MYRYFLNGKTSPWNSESRKQTKVIPLKATVYSCLWLEDQVKMQNSSYSSSAYTVIYLEITYKYYSRTTNSVNNNDKLLLSLIIGTVNFAGRNKRSDQSYGWVYPFKLVSCLTLLLFLISRAHVNFVLNLKKRIKTEEKTPTFTPGFTNHC